MSIVTPEFNKYTRLLPAQREGSHFPMTIYSGHMGTTESSTTPRLMVYGTSATIAIVGAGLLFSTRDPSLPLSLIALGAGFGALPHLLKPFDVPPPQQTFYINSDKLIIRDMPANKEYTRLDMKSVRLLYNDQHPEKGFALQDENGLCPVGFQLYPKERPVFKDMIVDEITAWRNDRSLPGPAFITIGGR